MVQLSTDGESESNMGKTSDSVWENHTSTYTWCLPVMTMRQFLCEMAKVIKHSIIECHLLNVLMYIPPNNTWKHKQIRGMTTFFRNEH